MSTDKPLPHLEEGDLIISGNVRSGLYEVLSVNHPQAGAGDLELARIYLTWPPERERSFDYGKIHFHGDFKDGVYIRGVDRKLSYLASLLVRANASGDVSEIHELLIKVDV